MPIPKEFVAISLKREILLGIVALVKKVIIYALIQSVPSLNLFCADPTCVQCNACFVASDHTGHEVRFHKAGVGGCCDCGDLEAWDEAGCCPQHRPRDNLNEVEPVSALPENLVQSARVVIQEAVKLVGKEISAGVSNFEFALEGGTHKLAPLDHLNEFSATKIDYVIRLHNDDVHTYDEVTSTLMACGVNGNVLSFTM